MPNTDTIFALSSAPGKAGVAIIRISGSHAFNTLQSLTRSTLPPPRVATLRTLYHSNSNVIDHALVLCFAAPNSFTGEDVVELHIHGSRAIQLMCIEYLSRTPHLRLAEPGEFTRRAFDCGKMDLLEVEALADIIDAETEAQARQAIRQFEGHMGTIYMDMRGRIVECLALLEAYIDFPEEDIPESVFENISQNISTLAHLITHSLADNRIGERIRSGFRIAIIGAPNVGKSSLLNMLAKREAAIVSAIPGTTRDVIELSMNIDGFAVILSDTAGIRDTHDEIEMVGIGRSKETLIQSDIAIVLIDSTNIPLSLASVPLETLVNYTGRIIIAINKMDACEHQQHLNSQVVDFCSNNGLSAESIVNISVKNGTIQPLETSLSAALSAMLPSEEPLITQSRHRTLLSQALEHLQRSTHPLPLELRCEELRLAASDIGKISGTILPDELLGEIFSKFCIGK